MFSLILQQNLISQAYADQNVGILLEFPSTNPVRLGAGWRLKAAQGVRKECIDFKTASNTYTDRRLSFTAVHDNESLAKALNVSVSGKISVMTGGGFSGSASFAHDTRFSATSTYIGVLAEVWTSPKFVAPVDGTKPKIQNLLEQITSLPKREAIDMSLFYSGKSVKIKPDLIELVKNDYQEFVRRCGDSFVAVIHSGAKLNGVFSFRETTKEERQKIHAEFQGSGATWSINARADSSLNAFKKNNRLNINFEQLGGNEGSLPLTKEGFLKAIRDLPNAAISAPRPFLMVVQRYDTLPDWPRPTIPKPLSNQEIVANTYWRLRSLLSYTDEALNNPGWLLKFDTTRQSVHNLYDEILTKLQTLRALAQTCSLRECDIGDWKTWTDWSLRSRLPYRGNFHSLNLGSTVETAINKLPYELAKARVDYWIREPDRWRCQYEQVCLKQSIISKMQREIEANIRSAIP